MPCVLILLHMVYTFMASAPQIVLGTIAAKCPGMPFARSALMNLESAYNLFEVVKETDRAVKILVRDFAVDVSILRTNREPYIARVTEIEE